MFGFGNSNAMPIGLDINHSSIKMLQLARVEDEIQVIAAEETCYDPEIGNDVQRRREFTVSSITDMLCRGAFSDRRVISCLPNDSLKIKSLRLDTTEPDKIEQFMRTEVAEHFGLNAQVDEIRYMIAGNAHQGDEIKNEVIFFGTSSKVLDRHISVLEDAGLVPVSIDAVPCALFRSFQASHRRQEDQNLVSVYVEVGSQFTTVIIGKGQEITFIKQIPIAGEHLNSIVSRRLDISLNDAVILRSKLQSRDSEAVDPSTRQAVIDAMNQSIEELAKEVSLCFRYYAVTFRGERPREAVFAGGEANEPTLLNALKRHLGVEIKIAQPLRGFDLSRVSLSEKEDTALCEWSVAVGLGIKGCDLSVCRA